MSRKMKTVDVKGKPYVTVNERIKAFRELHDTGRIVTKMMVTEGNENCLFTAEIYLGETLVSTGHAAEERGSSHINKTNFIENCETSAVGRALGFFGIGVDSAVASYEEAQHAKEKEAQHVPPTKAQIEEINKLWDVLGKEDKHQKALFKSYNKPEDSESWDVLTEEEMGAALNILRAQRDNIAKNVKGGRK
tara:strand:+ start:3004 stop:3579 length:576 start_codon:yes stop_codon:yes gene_type:complete